MKKMLSILILAGIVPWSALAEVKQAIQYNAEATQKLQERLNTITQEKDIATLAMLKSIDQLIAQGANPNTAPERNKEQPLVVLLFMVPYLNKDINASMVESIIKNALDKGAHLDLQGEKGDQLLRFIITMVESPAMVKLAIEYGADFTHKNAQHGNTLLESIDEGIQNMKNSIKRIQEVDLPMLQKGLQRYDQVRDILKAAAQKK